MTMRQIIADESLVYSPSPEGWPLVTPTYLFNRKLLLRIKQAVFHDREIDVMSDSENFRRWDWVPGPNNRDYLWLERTKRNSEIFWRCASYHDVPIIDAATKEPLGFVRCRRAAVFLLKKSNPCHP